MQGLAAFDGVMLPLDPVCFRQIAQPLDQRVFLVGRDQQVMRSVGVGGPTPVTGIDVLQVVHRQVHELGHDAEVHLGAGFDAREIGFVGNIGQLDAIFGRVGDDAGHGHELGHVMARLGLELLQVGIAVRLALAAVLRAGAHHPAFAGVVGGQRQVPVAVKIVVELLEIIQRRLRGGLHVAPAVVPPVGLQAVQAAGGRNELPQARGAGAGVGVRLVGALDGGQQRDFHRHAALVHFVDDVIEIQAGALHHALHVFGVVGEPAGLAFHQRAVERLDGKSGADSGPDIGIVACRFLVESGVGLAALRPWRRLPRPARGSLLQKRTEQPPPAPNPWRSERSPGRLSRIRRWPGAEQRKGADS